MPKVEHPAIVHPQSRTRSGDCLTPAVPHTHNQVPQSELSEERHLPHAPRRGPSPVLSARADAVSHDGGPPCAQFAAESKVPLRRIVQLSGISQEHSEPPRATRLCWYSPCSLLQLSGAGTRVGRGWARAWRVTSQCLVMNQCTLLASCEREQQERTSVH